ncbi:PhzF family phenazine biosynthesis protein [Aestuariivita sp.]|uniref:PhzF family phenazine biosynthesis protein n=1 Tax=Aestuariivita sp. TaxID=1872407 RepID=UPI00216DB15E|nr:PhzF family phenazine biosynthesis protein [Aestuariivita sp.]MCE8007742.1 PhzF family phenazine biosynthesis protein [Aestuariivita sp.]
MSQDFPVDWVDAFADRPFGGNGCAVVHGGATLDAETAMQFVRETSLVECTFTGPSDIADIRVRYFLASREIPFAGHPTLATAAALQARGMIKEDRVVLETGAGLVPVVLDQNSYEMTQIAPEFGVHPDPGLVAAAVGLREEDIAAPPQLVSTGLPFVITLLKSKDALRRAQVNGDALAGLCTALGHDDTDLMEPFLVTLGGATEAGDTFSRLLLAPPSPPEDAFTGSATGAMAAYLWRHGLLDQSSFLAEQGHWMGRPGQARVTRVGPAEAMTGVRVSGQAWRLMSGVLHL